MFISKEAVKDKRKADGKKGLSFVLLVLLATTGCASIPPGYVKIVPAPVRTFRPLQPALIRLPVEIIFPTGAQVGQHLDGFFSELLRPKRDKPDPTLGIHTMWSVVDIWAWIQKPIYLDKGIWLLMRPQTLSLGSMRTDPKKVWTAHTMIETTSNPEVIFGAKPATTPLPMPPLSAFVAGDPIFQAVSNTRMSYQEANAHLHDPRMKLIGMVLPGSGGQKLTIKNIRMYGSGGQVIVEVKLSYQPFIVNLGSKPAKLTVYLKGTPHYLKKEQAFDLPDLDYDLHSEDLMVQMADLFFKGDFKDQMRRVARLPIGPKLDELKGMIDKALNRPLGGFARLSANVSSLKVLNAYADNEGVVVRVSIEGTAGVQVIWN